MYHLIRVITHTILFFLRKKLGGFSWGRFRGRGSWWRPKKGGEFYWQKYKWHLIFNQKSVSHVPVLHVRNVFFFFRSWMKDSPWLIATLFHIINLAVKANILRCVHAKIHVCMSIHQVIVCYFKREALMTRTVMTKSRIPPPAGNPTSLTIYVMESRILWPMYMVLCRK